MHLARLLALSVALTACSEEDTPTDAGPADAGADAPAVVDRGSISESAESRDEFEHHLAIAPDGTLGVVWVEEPLGGGEFPLGVAFSRDRGDTFTRPYRLHSPGGAAADPVITTEAMGRFVIVWLEHADDGSRLLAARTDENLALGEAWVDGDLVFCDEAGRELHPDRFSRAFTSAAKRASVRPIRLHDLRHTWATLALQAGIHPKVVSERLGHATTGITLDVYSHVQPEMDAEAASAVAKLFS